MPNFCHNCQTQLLGGAKFCHACGEKVQERRPCPQCGGDNPASAKFCIHCGYDMLQQRRQQRPENDGQEGQGHYVPRFPLDFSRPAQMDAEIKAHFFKQLREKVQDELGLANYEAFVDAFYASGFHDDIFKRRAAQLAEEAYTIHCQQHPNVLREVDHLLGQQLEGLLDHFAILYAANLNPVRLPEAILRYTNVRREEVDIAHMIVDYLDPDREQEKFYRDFISISKTKILQNAVQAFIRAEQQEKLLLLCDQSVFGNGKLGFALTDRGLYWKAHFYKAQALRYGELREVKREADWLSINGAYFHVSRSVNLKMLKLLRKLQQMAFL